MKKYLIILIVGCALAYWYRLPCYVQPGRAGVAPEPIKRAMLKMGPYKNYRIIGGRLQVQVKGKWLNLKTEKGD